ncbi:pilus assembly protein PilZ [Sphingosinicella sp. LHD-64]|uniref:pilus assembly protein PilZ n=1 Tax=Sphingosinicella sp. LHD-64 TaxID=3072139 RepID=UPI00280CBCB3|nr:pilus assembly protein PilZ [Sphingosinicella sp. LHD-64]MDQ8756766.1 pilus assembly protein PilZ [Sphingosinicella sp. LHD-64]
MTKAQLAIIPAADGRKAERRIVNLAARLRDRGTSLIDIEVMNLSTDGFMAHISAALEVGSHAWLKLTGLEPQNSRVAWVEEGKAGFEFVSPLHPATVQLVVALGRKSAPQNHFGPRGRR